MHSSSSLSSVCPVCIVHTCFDVHGFADILSSFLGAASVCRWGAEMGAGSSGLNAGIDTCGDWRGQIAYKSCTNTAPLMNIGYCYSTK